MLIKPHAEHHFMKFESPLIIVTAACNKIELLRPSPSGNKNLEFQGK